MTRSLDLEDLRVLALVASAGSIGRAAATLGLSQPTVSRRMAALERSWRVPLLERTSQGTTLTPTGQVVVDWAAVVLESAEEFTRSLSTLQQPQRPTVRTAVSMTIAEHYAPRWLGILRQGEPEMNFSLLVHNSSQVVALVAAGEAEVGFIESPVVPESLAHRRIGWDRLVVAVAPGHPWSKGGRVVSAGEVSGAPLLVREQGSGTRETLRDALDRHGLALVPAQEMASNAALKSAAVSGMGPVVLSELSLAAEIGSGQLVAIEVPDLELRRPLTAVWRRDVPISSAASALYQVAVRDG